MTDTLKVLAVVFAVGGMVSVWGGYYHRSTNCFAIAYIFAVLSW